MKTLSEEHKRKIALAHKGKKRKPFTEEHKRKLRIAHLGKKQSKETIEKRVKQFRGVKSPLWKGGRASGDNRKNYLKIKN